MERQNLYQFRRAINHGKLTPGLITSSEKIEVKNCQNVYCLRLYLRNNIQSIEGLNATTELLSKCVEWSDLW